VKAPAGMPVPALVHGGEYVLSQDMLAGRQPITGLPAGVRTLDAGRPASLPTARGAASTYNITVNAGMGASGQDVGAAVVAAIKQYERTNSASWRS
jgi:hypothetical protein